MKKPPAMKLYTAAILVIFWLGVFAVHIVKGSIASQSMRGFKCVTTRTQKLNVRNLVSYERQLHPIEATLFITKNGKKFCANSNDDWVRKATKEIDRRRTTKGKPRTRKASRQGK